MPYGIICNASEQKIIYFKKQGKYYVVYDRHQQFSTWGT